MSSSFGWPSTSGLFDDEDAEEGESSFERQVNQQTKNYFIEDHSHILKFAPRDYIHCYNGR